jgi:hypothetical protein
MPTIIKEIYFHEGNGHNFSLEFLSNKKVIMNRYYTNGHVNSDYEKSKQISIEKMSEFFQRDISLLEKYNPNLKDTAEAVWFTDLINY